MKRELKNTHPCSIRKTCADEERNHQSNCYITTKNYDKFRKFYVQFSIIKRVQELI